MTLALMLIDLCNLIRLDEFSSSIHRRHIVTLDVGSDAAHFLQEIRSDQSSHKGKEEEEGSIPLKPEH